jgi:hypothetical protein
MTLTSSSVLPSEALNAAVSWSSFPLEAAVISTLADSGLLAEYGFHVFSFLTSSELVFLKTGLHFFQNGKYRARVAFAVRRFNAELFDGLVCFAGWSL